MRNRRSDPFGEVLGAGTLTGIGKQHRDHIVEAGIFVSISCGPRFSTIRILKLRVRIDIIPNRSCTVSARAWDQLVYVLGK